jgi:Zn-dependent metalloprotease
MCTDRHPIHCIIPPFVLRAMAESRDRRVRESALRTLMVSAHIRGQRQVLGGVQAAVRGATPGQQRRRIHDAKGQMLNDWELPGGLVRDEGQAPASDPTVNEAYDGLGATYDFYAEVFNRNSIDDRGMPLIATVHFGEDYNNAFWNGNQMVFGDGDNVIFTSFTKSLDVIGHELTHGVVDHTCDLIYHVQPGALNESFADVFGSLVKQYSKGQTVESADWLIGADIIAPGINGVALRSMRDPGSAYDDPQMGGKDPQPKHMNGYVQLPDDPWNDYGGVHINSGIPNHAFYLVAKQLGGNAWEDAGTIWYQAMLQLWPTAQFEDCVNVTTQIAGAEFGTGSAQQQAVKTAWEQVGLQGTAPHPARRRRRVGRALPAEANGAQFKQQLERLAEELRRTIAAMP